MPKIPQNQIIPFICRIHLFADRDSSACVVYAICSSGFIMKAIQVFVVSVNF